jgi:type II secretion system protein G
VSNVKNKGFTLIELLIVVAIIAILAAIAVPNFLEAQVRSKVSRAKSDIRTMATALESYAVDNNGYPPDITTTDGRTIGAG